MFGVYAQETLQFSLYRSVARLEPKKGKRSEKLEFHLPATVISCTFFGLEDGSAFVLHWGLLIVW
jgi:hypothetical protein